MGSLAHLWKQEGIEEERAKRKMKIKKEKFTIAKEMMANEEPLKIKYTNLR